MLVYATRVRCVVCEHRDTTALQVLLKRLLHKADCSQLPDIDVQGQLVSQSKALSVKLTQVSTPAERWGVHHEGHRGVRWMEQHPCTHQGGRRPPVEGA